MNTFNEEFNQMINREKEISGVVRKRLDQVYEDIRSDKKSTPVIKHSFGKWLVGVAAAALCIFIFTNDEVRASLKTFFGMDQAAQIAAEQHFFNEVDEKVSDQGITLQLTTVFADAVHIGFQISGKAEDRKLLKDIETINFSYYIKDANGTYVIDQVGDERFELKSSDPYQVTPKTNLLTGSDQKEGTFTQQFMLESQKGLISNLDDAEIAIISINFKAENGKTKTIDGHWEIAFDPDMESKTDLKVPYQATAVAGDIETVTAAADATGLRVGFQCKQAGAVLELLEIKVIDQDGAEYIGTGYQVDDETQMIDVILPYSAFQEEEALQLVVLNRRDGEKIGSAELTREE